MFNTYALECFIILQVFVLFTSASEQDLQTNVTGIKNCWSGSNNPSAFNYPPRMVPCNGVNLVCQRNHENETNIYEMLCATIEYCVSEYQSSDLNQSIWSEILCCFTDSCNVYPGQPPYNGMPNAGHLSVPFGVTHVLLAMLLLTYATLF